MASLARTLAILTLPAAAIGALGGLALRAVSDGPTETDAPAAGVTVGTTARGETVGDPPTRRESRAPRPRASRPAAGGGAAQSVPKLDPELGRRLSSADEATRLACALEILEMNPPWQAVDALPISGEPATKLRDALVNSLETLGRIERGNDHAGKPELAKLQVRLKYYGKVVPDALLAKLRRRYFELCVELDGARTGSNAPTPGEAAWRRLELARAKHELGEMDDAEWRRVFDAEIGLVRGWAAEIGLKRDVGRDRVREAQEALLRLEASR